MTKLNDRQIKKIRQVRAMLNTADAILADITEHLQENLERGDIITSHQIKDFIKAREAISKASDLTGIIF